MSDISAFIYSVRTYRGKAAFAFEMYDFCLLAGTPLVLSDNISLYKLHEIIPNDLSFVRPVEHVAFKMQKLEDTCTTFPKY